MIAIFSGIYGRGPVQQELSDEAFVQAMLDTEAALAWALVRCGLARSADAEELSSVCRDASSFDVDAIGRSTAEKGTPVPGLLAAVRERLSEQGAGTLHRGATSQDIVDTALMLVSRRAIDRLQRELSTAGVACAKLVQEHRGTLMGGRTLLQQALPITFGLKAAGWLNGLTAVRSALASVRRQVLAVQLGGAVGTLAALGDQGLAVMAAVAVELELADPGMPWHTLRVRPARLASALGEALGVMGKIAGDLVLLAQTEVAEVAEAAASGRGGSSTMPHKRNPVGAVAVLACVQRAPGLVASLLSSMPQEHERAAGSWQGEWGPLLELLALAGSAATSLGETLGMLNVDAARMQANLDSLMMAESVVTALGGGPAAQNLVEQAAQSALREQRRFRDVLLESSEVDRRLGADGLDRALDPQRYLGVADQLIDRALSAHVAVPEA